MTFDEVDAVAPCLFPSDPEKTAPCGSVEATLVSLSIVPEHGAVETGGTFPFIAIAGYSDGTNVVVTTGSTWRVSDETIAEIGENTGIAGSLLEPPVNGGFNDRTVTVQATYQGIMAEAYLRCFSVCSSVNMDIVLVLDRSASMASVAACGKTRLELVADAAQIIVDNASSTRDRIGIVSFAGKIWLNTTGVDHTEKESTLDCQLTNSRADLTTALTSTYAIRGDCAATAPMQCQTGIGGGLEDALTELTSSRHRAGAQRVIILFTDGAENISNPNPEVPANDAKDNYDTIILTVGLGVPSTFQSRLNALASANKSYNITKAEDVLGIFATISHVLCMEGDPVYGYTVNPYYGYGMPGTPSGTIGTNVPTELTVAIPIGYFPGFRENIGDSFTPTAAESAYLETLFTEAVAADRATMEDATIYPCNPAGTGPMYTYKETGDVYFIWGYFDNPWGAIQNTERRHLGAEALGDFDTKLTAPFGWTAFKNVTYTINTCE